MKRLQGYLEMMTFNNDVDILVSKNELIHFSFTKSCDVQHISFTNTYQIREKKEQHQAEKDFQDCLGDEMVIESNRVG